MDLKVFLHFGYSLVIITYLLMIWISLSEARHMEYNRYPPCFFNPLCSCSKGVTDLGIVRCQDIHLPKIPDTVNISKVFMLHLENNGLRTMEPYFLQSTGLYKIAISKNPLAVIPDEAFLGLERSLWELDLSFNQLTQVPNRALRYLQKLRYLDLTGNHISKVTPESWRGLENSLITLILSDNSINTLTTDLFSGLPMVETIDLRGNNLKEIDPSVFRDGMGKLTTLILADNQLNAIPYQALSYLKMLKTLDLSYNKINKMQPAAEVGVQSANYNFQLNLDDFKLDYNQITVLDTLSFQYFNALNRTSLDGNPIEEIEESAFRNAKIRELYLRKCGLKDISPVAFDGLESYLEILDLSGNSLSTLPEDVFHRLSLLRTLSLSDNVLSKLNPVEAFNSFQFTLYKLDLRGSENAATNIQQLQRLRNLRVLSLSRLSQKTLAPEDFAEFGVDLEILEINNAGLQTIKNNAFRHVHGLKTINLEDNYISSIESNAFSDIGHSLITLKLCHALSMQSLSTDTLRVLVNLEELDISNNKISNLADTSFHFLKNLRVLNIQDNTIDLIHKGTFQGDIHHNLNEIYFSFNNIKLIQQHTFVDLDHLEELYLDDNKITSLERRSFMNLENLKILNLKGNKLATIPYETFQNLPELENLDLSYNSLNIFDFTMLDQVGTLSMFKVNASHNKLTDLVVTPSASFGPELGMNSLHSNIKVLDMSFNNITTISPQFFRPTEISITHLYLSHNHLLNATKDAFGNMPHLQLLDLSYNSLYGLDFDTFRNSKKLQLLYASYNKIAEIPNDLFRFLTNLRIVDFSHNRLRSLPDNLFREEGLERLDVSHNLLSKLPLMSLSVASAQTLCELDLSWNYVSSLAHGGMLSRFKKLSWLDLSYNRLAQIDAGTFKGLPRLSSLNLGHNAQLALEANGLSFQGLEYSLLDLNLDNTSLANIPILPTHNLLFLSVAFNGIPTVPPEMAGNISSLQIFNLNNNDLTAVPIVTHSLNDLRSLSMGFNPITSLTNTSLLGVANHLEELDIRNLPLTTFEFGVFCKMLPLSTLKISLFPVKNFNIPTILKFNSGLKDLEIHIEKEENLDKYMQGTFPTKLQNLTLTGKGLKKLDSGMLKGVRSPHFHLCLRNTSVIKVPSDLFRNIGRAKNVSVDVRDNIALKNLQNPSTGSKPNLYRSTFLMDLKMTGSKWSCDCDLGWVEVWQRKRRQYLCEFNNLLHSSYDQQCRRPDDDLRTSLCSNKNNQSLIEVLKVDIECGWSKGSSTVDTIWINLIVLVQLSVVYWIW